jgi:hypothetical protein
MPVLVVISDGHSHDAISDVYPRGSEIGAGDTSFHANPSDARNQVRYLR